ncbi:MAG: pyruvate ferredoxin oxidoreductase [Chloroflexi bacterium]|nr:pyruvate ferredoxin oxidoreductase [Chloroflexota bacterium]
MARQVRAGSVRIQARGNAVALSGGEAVAYAMRQIDPDVVAVYPITPQTVIVEAFSESVAEGKVGTEMIHVESEHAALSACIGAAAAGARAHTATSGPGLALMWEVLGVASGMRLPIVMHLCTRALSAPINIMCDHSDAMAMRDLGWVMLFGENPQEAYDQALIVQRVAEHRDVLLPSVNVIDGFTVTHSVEGVEVLPDEVVASFVGTYSPLYSLLDPQRRVTFGALDPNEYYYEHKRQQIEAMKNALPVVAATLQEFGELTGRHYNLVEEYRTEDAEVVLVVMGSTAGTVRIAVDNLREDGVRAGVVRVRCFRPFPAEEVAQALRRAKLVGVLDRSLSLGAPGSSLYLEVMAALSQRMLSPYLVNVVHGLGGRNTPVRIIKEAFSQLRLMGLEEQRREPILYLGVRE